MAGLMQRGSSDTVEAVMGRDELIRILRYVVKGGGFDDAAQTEDAAKAALHHLTAVEEEMQGALDAIDGHAALQMDHDLHALVQHYRHALGVTDEPLVEEEPLRPFPADLQDLAAHVGRTTPSVFRANGWEWRGKTPDVAAIAATVNHLIENCQPNEAMATGRFQVDRFVEDGRETYSVTLEVGSVTGREEAR